MHIVSAVTHETMRSEQSCRIHAAWMPRHRRKRCRDSNPSSGILFRVSQKN